MTSHNFTDCAVTPLRRTRHALHTLPRPGACRTLIQSFDGDAGLRPVLKLRDVRSRPMRVVKFGASIAGVPGNNGMGDRLVGRAVPKGHTRRVSNLPVEFNSTTPRGESPNMVLGSSPCESRKKGDVVCVTQLRFDTRQMNRADFFVVSLIE